MAVFDVFVKGIDPGRIAEQEQIRKNVGKMFKLEGAKLDALFENQSGICIKRGASDVEAQKYQSTLAKMGMVCVCKPVKEKIELSLVPIEEAEASKDKMTCPVCDFTSKTGTDGELTRCENCGLQFEKYDQLNQGYDERSLMKQRVLKKAEIRKHAQNQVLEEERKREYQLKMEQEIAKELGLESSALTQVKSMSLRSKVMLGVFLGVGAGLIGGGYYLFAKEGDVDTLSSALKEGDAQLTFGSYSQPKLEQAKKIVEQVVSQTQSQSRYLVHPSINVNVVNDNSAENVGGAQQNIEKQVLSDSTLAKQIESSQVAEEGGRYADDIASLQATQHEIAQPGNAVFILDDIFSYQQHDFEWANFLWDQYRLMIEKGEMFQAYQLSIRQNDFAEQIDMIGEILLIYKKQGNTHLVSTFVAGLEKKVRMSPASDQAAFYAQIAKYQFLVINDATYFERALALAAKLGDANKQCIALGRIAVYQGQAGLAEQSRQTFELIKKIIKGIASVSGQAQSWSVLAKDYVDVGDQVGAKQAVVLAEQVLNKSSETNNNDMSLSALANAYTYMDDEYLARKTIEKIASQEMKAASSFENILTQLSMRHSYVALQALQYIDQVEYQAIGNGLVATFISKKYSLQADELFALAVARLDAIKLPLSRAVVASSLARMSLRKGSQGKARRLFKLAMSAAGEVEDKQQKDKVYALIAIDSARVFLFNQAEEAMDNIDSVALVEQVQQRYMEAKGVAGLLNH